MSINEIITAIKDVTLAVAGATTTVVAVLGLKGWHRELRGKANFEVARSLAKATYKLRDEVSMCRSPLIRATEFPESYRTPDTRTDGNDRASAYGQVFASRWGPVYSALQDFDTQTLEAEALWGGGIRTKTDELRSILRTLRAAIEAYISNEASEGEDFNTDKDFGRKIRAEVFATPSDAKNDLSGKLAAAVAAIENELRPHLRRA